MVEAIVTAVIQQYGVTHDQIKGPDRTRPLPEARRMIAQIMEHHGISRQDICKAVNRSRFNVCKGIQQLKDELPIYKTLLANYLKINAMIKTDLTQKQATIQQWLDNNPDADWKLRHDKIAELATIENQLQNF